MMDPFEGLSDEVIQEVVEFVEQMETFYEDIKKKITKNI